MKNRSIILVMVFAIIPTLCFADNVTIIANPSVSESALSSQKISKIYLGKKTTWDNGTKISFALLKGDTHNHFLKSYIHKTDSQYKIFWKKQIFTGKGAPPQVFDSNKAMINFVAKTPGAIGYVSGDVKAANVKTITVE